MLIPSAECKSLQGSGATRCAQGHQLLDDLARRRQLPATVTKRIVIPEAKLDAAFFQELNASFQVSDARWCQTCSGRSAVDSAVPWRRSQPAVCRA